MCYRYRMLSCYVLSSYENNLESMNELFSQNDVCKKCNLDLDRVAFRIFYFIWLEHSRCELHNENSTKSKMIVQCSNHSEKAFCYRSISKRETQENAQIIVRSSRYLTQRKSGKELSTTACRRSSLRLYYQRSINSNVDFSLGGQQSMPPKPEFL